MKTRRSWYLTLLPLLVVLLLPAPGTLDGQRGLSGAPAPAAGPAARSQDAGKRRVNAPTFDGKVLFKEAAILWFGQVTPTSNAVDVRVGYNSDHLYVRVAMFDRRLWYNKKPSSDDLDAYDAVTLYLSTDDNAGSVPGPNDYRLDAQLTWWEPRADYQAVYRGSGSSWVKTTLPFTTTAFWRGTAPNDEQDDRGWALAYTIPFDGLGSAQPPARGHIWGMALVVHDRDDAAGSPIPDQVWPEAMQPGQPGTWGELAFGMPTYDPPLAVADGSVTIRQGLDGAVVVDADVGGSSTCGSAAWPDYFPTWGELNYAGKTFLNIQNLHDVGDWPCFSRYYVTFPLDALPPGQVILSATLTLYQWGNAGQGYDPGPQPSLIQVLTVGEDWQEAALNWNNAPLAQENVAAAWAGVFPAWPGEPREWDVSGAVAQAYVRGLPLRLALYEGDWDYHSGKYFWSSDAGNEHAVRRPTLDITWGHAITGDPERVYIPLACRGN